MNHIAAQGIQFDYAVTLTFPKEPRDYIEAERHFGVFMRYLNERCYRRKFRRGEQRVTVLAIQEGMKHKRNHFHCALQRPSHLTDIEFKRRIHKSWTKVTFDPLALMKIDEYYSLGWLNYITKEVEYLDSTSISEHCHW